MSNVDTYLGLIEEAVVDTTDASIDALDAFEHANPNIADEAYQAGGPEVKGLAARVVNGTQHSFLLRADLV
tara:strand:+ start:224 stop:436 length:213 start_codon:yes stop_codon:yes gene_type:complete